MQVHVLRQLFKPAVVTVTTRSRMKFQSVGHEFRSEPGQLESFLTETHGEGFMRKLGKLLDTKRFHPNPAVIKQLRTLALRLARCVNDKKYRLVPIGSCMNGLASSSSDIDLVLMPTDTDPEEFCLHAHKNRLHGNLLRKVVIQQFYNNRMVKQNSVQPILHATVPIMRFVEARSNVIVDVQVGNQGTILSTNYIRACVQVDERVATVIRWLNFAAKTYRVKDPSMMSSYHLCSLALFFLQHNYNGENSVIPNLIKTCPLVDPEMKWQRAANLMVDNAEIRLWEDFVPSPDPIESIVVKLIDFYSSLDLEEVGLDLRTGQVIVKDEEDNGDSCLLLRDPYFAREKSTCRVKNAASIIHGFFAELRNQLEGGRPVLWNSRGEKK